MRTNQHTEALYDRPVREVRAELETMSNATFARKYGVSRPTVQRLRKQLGVEAHHKYQRAPKS